MQEREYFSKKGFEDLPLGTEKSGHNMSSTFQRQVALLEEICDTGAEGTGILRQRGLGIFQLMSNAQGERTWDL